MAKPDPEEDENTIKSLVAKLKVRVDRSDRIIDKLNRQVLNNYQRVDRLEGELLATCLEHRRQLFKLVESKKLDLDNRLEAHEIQSRAWSGRLFATLIGTFQYAAGHLQREGERETPVTALEAMRVADPISPDDDLVPRQEEEMTTDFLARHRAAGSLSVRAINAIQDELGSSEKWAIKISTVKELLAECRAGNLQRVRSIGKVTYREIATLLESEKKP